MAQLRAEALSKLHNRESFNCGVESLNDYFKKQANQDVKRRLAACFVMLNGDNETIGYYTLSNAGIPKEEIPDDYQRKLPYKDLPVTLLGRLAVDERFSGNGMGSMLLLNALEKCFELSKSIGSVAVVVDPINDQARRFYKKFGFRDIPDRGRMFLLMKDVAQLF